MNCRPRKRKIPRQRSRHQVVRTFYLVVQQTTSKLQRKIFNLNLQYFCFQSKPLFLCFHFFVWLKFGITIVYCEDFSTFSCAESGSHFTEFHYNAAHTCTCSTAKDTSFLQDCECLPWRLTRIDPSLGLKLEYFERGSTHLSHDVGGRFIQLIYFSCMLRVTVIRIAALLISW